MTPATYDPEVDSLTTILKRCGYTHRRSTTLGAREIVNVAGEVVFVGRCDETLAWLDETNQAVAVVSP